MRPLAVRWLGRVAYPEALALQDVQVAARRAGDVPDTLLLPRAPSRGHAGEERARREPPAVPGSPGGAGRGPARERAAAAT
jgi:hypothetical protein